MAGSTPVDFRFVERADTYAFVRRFPLVRSRYLRLPRSDKGLVRRFLIPGDGIQPGSDGASDHPVPGDRRISRFGGGVRSEARHRPHGVAVPPSLHGEGHPSAGQESTSPCPVLAVRAVLAALSRGARCSVSTRCTAMRGSGVWRGISHSHPCRLRQSVTYRRRRLTVVKTRPTRVRIGERRKPHPAGQPGYLRVDTVHQGDLDGRKGLYEINLVDEVTQYEFVAATEGMSEAVPDPGSAGRDRGLPLQRQGFPPEIPRRRRAVSAARRHLRAARPSGPGHRRPRRCQGSQRGSRRVLRQGSDAATLSHERTRPASRETEPANGRHDTHSAHFNRRLAVPALPLVSGADLRSAPISSPENCPDALALTRLPNNRRFRLIFEWD